MHHLQQWEDQKSTPKCGLFIPGLSFTSLKVAKTKLEAEQNQVFRHDCPFFPASCWTVKTRAQPFPWLQIIYVRVYKQIPISKGTELMKLKLFWVWFYIQLRSSFLCFGKKWGVYVCVCLRLCVFTLWWFHWWWEFKCACSFLMVSLYKTNTIDLEGKSPAKDSSNGFALSKFNAIFFGQQLQLWKEAIHLLPKITMRS